MIDYTRESKLNAYSAVGKIKKDLIENKWGRGLTINRQAGLILPCKIVVYDKLDGLAIEAEDALKKIIDIQ